MFTLFIVLYFIGSICAYYRARLTWMRCVSKYAMLSEPTWDRVFMCILSALFSWIGYVVALWVDDTTNTNLPGPPKWL